MTKRWKQTKKRNEWKKGDLKIKTWFGFETGGYDVFRGRKRLNKVTFPSFPKAKKFAKSLTLKKK